jgi:DNA-directed RNA polymerase subunit RPC12/RpoP
MTERETWRKVNLPQPPRWLRWLRPRGRFWDIALECPCGYRRVLRGKEADALSMRGFRSIPKGKSENVYEESIRCRRCGRSYPYVSHYSIAPMDWF